jgi:DIE2/ALG10 family
VYAISQNYGAACTCRYYRTYLVKALLVSSRSARWLLLPAYLAAGTALWGLLQGAQPSLWTLGYAACTAAVLVPAKMIEFRWLGCTQHNFPCCRHPGSCQSSLRACAAFSKGHCRMLGC